MMTTPEAGTPPRVTKNDTLYGCLNVKNPHPDDSGPSVIRKADNINNKLYLQDQTSTYSTARAIKKP